MESKRKMASPSVEWSTLPSDILAQVIAKVGSHDRTCVRLTCRHWRDAVATTTQNLAPRKLVPCVINAFPAVTGLDLSRCAVRPGDILRLECSDQLRALTLQNRDELGDPLRELTVLSGLSRLQLKMFSATGPEIYHLRRLPNLQHVSMRCMPEVDGDALEALVASLTCLTEVELHRQEVDFRPLQKGATISCNVLASLPSLRRISLAGLTGTNSEDLLSLTALQSLESLELTRWAMSPAGIAAVARLTSLTKAVLVAGRRSPGTFSEQPTSSDIAHLAALTRLQSLKVSGCIWGQHKAALSQLSSLKALTQLDLSSPRARRHLMADAAVLHAFPLEQLRSLSLQCASCSGSLLEPLARASCLHHLDLTDCCDMLASDLHNLSGVTRLQSLRMEGCDMLWPCRPEDWACASALGCLTSLSFSHSAAHPLWLLTHGVLEDASSSAALLTHAHHLTALRRLVMPQQSLSPAEEVGVRLGYLTALTELDLSGAFCEEGGPIDAALQHLKSLTGLRKLHLADTYITLAGFHIIGQLTGLVWLDLCHTSLCDVGLRQLRRLRRLRSLAAGSSFQPAVAGIGDAGISHLAAHHPELERLSLSRLRCVTAAGLQPLAQLPQLAYLDLREFHLAETSAVLSSLQGCTALRELLIGGAEGIYCPSAFQVVHSSQLASFRSSMPHLTLLELGAQVVSGRGSELLSMLHFKLRGVLLAACRAYVGVLEKYQGWRPGHE